MDNRLSFRQEIKRKLLQCRKRNAYIFRIHRAIKSKLRLLWRGYVESYLLYGLKSYYSLLAEDLKDDLKMFYHSSARKIAWCYPNNPACTALREAGLEEWENLMKRCSGVEVEKFQKNCIDLKFSMEARSQELVFSRWRNNWLASGESLAHRHMTENPFCRYCQSAIESREHLLFYCKEINQTAKYEYEGKVEQILRKDFSTCSLNELLGFGDHPISKKRALAKALWRFCFDSGFWS